MTMITGIAQIDRRITVIESKIAVHRGTTTAIGAVDAGSVSTEIDGPKDPTIGFDAFGTAYQQAMSEYGIGGPPAGNAGTAATTETAALGRIDSAGFAARVAAGGSTVGQVGGYGDMPVPATLASYGNGQIPSTALEPIGQGEHRLYAPAAQAWKAAVAAARADGVELTVTDSYRSYDQQVALAADKGLYRDGGLAAVPGTSNHGWGMALDVNVDNPAAKSWLEANGHRFGFVEAVRREPWHWEYRPSQA